MKPVTHAVIAAEALDLATTCAGLLWFPTWEAHPAGLCALIIAAKIIGTAGICVVLERRNFSRLAWVIPGVAGLPVAWNALVIACEIAVR
jgi:hypothetical protein